MAEYSEFESGFLDFCLRMIENDDCDDWQQMNADDTESCPKFKMFKKDSKFGEEMKHLPFHFSFRFG